MEVLNVIREVKGLTKEAETYHQAGNPFEAKVRLINIADYIKMNIEPEESPPPPTPESPEPPEQETETPGSAPG